jgi:Xaa-Pro aminopeptidase
VTGLSGEVRNYRHRLLRDYVGSQGFDAIAFTGAEWFEWAANHPIRELAWERPYLLVVAADGSSFAAIAQQSRLHVERSTERGAFWIDRVSFFSESPARGDDFWLTPQWPEMVAAELRDAGLDRARIGVEALTGPLARVASLLPALELVPLDRSVRSLRWVKHREEIDTMRTAASLCDWAMAQYRDLLAPGRLLAEIDHLVSARLAVEAARRVPESDFVIGPLKTLSGPLSACPKGDGASTAATVEPDRIAVSTVPARLNGLAVELARTWLVGTPSDEELRLFDSVREAHETAAEEFVAGRNVASIHAAAQRCFDEQGLGQHLHLRSGHGIGVTIHDFPEDLPFQDRALLANETYAVEPSLYIRDIGGFRFADTVAVGADAPEFLTASPRDRASLSIN